MLSDIACSDRFFDNDGGGDGRGDGGGDGGFHIQTNVHCCMLYK